MATIKAINQQAPDIQAIKPFCQMDLIDAVTRLMVYYQLAKQNFIWFDLNPNTLTTGAKVKKFSDLLQKNSKGPQINAKRGSIRASHFNFSAINSDQHHMVNVIYYLDEQAMPHLDVYRQNNIYSWAGSKAKTAYLTWCYFYLKSYYDAIISQTTAIENLAKLFYIQKSKLKPMVKTDESKYAIHDLSTDMQDFIQDFHYNSNSSLSDFVEITNHELVDFMIDIQNNRPISKISLNWIVSIATKSLSSPNVNEKQLALKMIRDLNLNDKLIKLKKDDAVMTHIKQQLNQDHDFQQQFKIQKIYQIKNSQPAKPFKHHQQLLHGTQNFSILPILSKGLLDAKTLHQHASSYYQYTGSGLGNGIYFAKPTESLKPAHYTGHYSNYEENHYLILADIGYNSSKTVSQYDNYSHQADLVHAIGVGSGNRDEFLVNQANQIQLQYLISITHR